MEQHKKKKKKEIRQGIVDLYAVPRTEKVCINVDDAAGPVAPKVGRALEAEGL